MLNSYTLVSQLTSPHFSFATSRRMLNDFAEQFGWRPSDHLDVPSLRQIANAHLLVERGLENSAVISFLQRPWASLAYVERQQLLGVSYNNLVDWHIQIQPSEVTYVYNRVEPAREVVTRRLERDSIEKLLRSEAFESVTGQRPNPNLPALDDALIRSISDWRRNLASEIGTEVPTSAFSALFNAIILVRAIEDHRRRQLSSEIAFPLFADNRDTLLLNEWDEANQRPLRIVLRDCLRRLNQLVVPSYLLQDEALQPFDGLDALTIRALLSSFYRNQSYHYDFSLISQHALSRIYEKYVATLVTTQEAKDGSQLYLIPPLPQERRNKAFGAYYTPSYIARFFSRYLQEQMPPQTFKRLRAADPACGSGIFLRSLLELQNDPIHDSSQTIQTTFENVWGSDVEEDAAKAAQLSVALLYLVLTDTLPPTLNIFGAEAIEYYQSHSELYGTFGAILANPPFIALERQPEALRQRIASYLQQHASGRTDLYLAFLHLALDLLKPGGYGLFVLPHSFLLTKTATNIRKLLAEQTWIRCLADLSGVDVFWEAKVYPILLIFQKKSEGVTTPPLATIVKCNDLVGQALSDVVEHRFTENRYYSIYEIGQHIFDADEWVILPREQLEIARKFRELPTLHEFVESRAGYVSTADKVFIRAAKDVPVREREVYRPFLADRTMRLYTTPEKTDRVAFYPFIEGKKLTDTQMQARFPKTWAYLESNRATLEARSTVKKQRLDWWLPEQTRQPTQLLRPKIVSPHLVLVPRFSLDLKGEYIVSRGPFLFARQEEEQYDVLRYFLAVLNSTPCYWFISHNAQKYGRGYIQLEAVSIRRTPVPDPTKVPLDQMRRLLSLVDNRLVATGIEAIKIEKELDNLVADLYGLSEEEKRAIGMGED